MPRILNVNDRTTTRYLTTRMLQLAGFTVLEAANGMEALDRAREMPDLVVLDVRLPDLSGIEVCRRLKAGRETAGMPILLTSATFVTAESRVYGLESGADGYLAQPFEDSELIATVRSLLRMKRAEREAQDALRMRDEFLGTASHELKTPLTTLLLQIDAIERMLRAPAGFDRPRLSNRVEALRRQGERLTGLVDELLDISRLSAGRIVFEPQDVDLDAIARDVLDRFQEVVTHAGCEVTLRSRPGAIGRWDPARIEQVISNLLMNAVKYAQGRPIDVEVSADEQVATFVLRDRGPGIAPEDHERIFRRFERAVSSRHVSGLGLGLWIVRELVNAMGGRVSVQSALGDGTAFTVALPRAPSYAVSGEDDEADALAPSIRTAH